MCCPPPPLWRHNVKPYFALIGKYPTNNAWYLNALDVHGFHIHIHVYDTVQRYLFIHKLLLTPDIGANQFCDKNRIFNTHCFVWIILHINLNENFETCRSGQLIPVLNATLFIAIILLTVMYISPEDPSLMNEHCLFVHKNPNYIWTCFSRLGVPFHTKPVPWKMPCVFSVL